MKSNLWFHPNNHLILPEILKFPLLTTVHRLNHWSTDKITVLRDTIDW